MRTATKPSRALAVMGALALVAVACQPGTEEAGRDVSVTSGPGAPTTQQPAETETGSETGAVESFSFPIAIFEDLTTDNYWAYGDPETSVWNGYVLAHQPIQMFTQQAPDFTLVPQLAEGLPAEPVQRGDQWVITQSLRGGVEWSDGGPITADDVAFTFNTVRDLGLGGNWLTNFPLGRADDAGTPEDEFVLGLTAVEAVDTHTVELAWNGEPGLSLWQYGAAIAPILPQHFWEAEVAAAASADDLYAADGAGAPSAGPYDFDAWEPGAFARNVANTNYTFAGSTSTFYEDGSYRFQSPGLGVDETFYGEATGPERLAYSEGPYAEDVTYTIYGTQDAAVLALQEGEVDYMLNSLGLQRGLQTLILSEPELEIIVNPANSYRYLAFNTRRFPGSDVTFRRAVACMIDKDFMASQVLQGAALAAWGQVPAGNAFWYNPDTPRLCDGMSQQERASTATAMLREAGWSWDVEPVWNEDNLDVIPQGQGLRGPDGTLVPELTLLAPGPGYDPLRATYSLWIADWATDLGVPLTAEPTGFNVIVDRVFQDDPDFDMYILGWSLTPFPNHLVAFFESSQDAALGGLNTPGYNNAAYDELAVAFNASTDVDDARRLIAEMDAILAEENPYVVLFSTPILEAHRADVTFPYTDVLSGVQYVNGLPSYVRVAE